ncbi:ABC transporter ATP-binding protein [Clostridium beijerinckii]|uniref:ABC transporter ATP-binding protein n=1 Tax=Clostridium beijerinckii TaxID=1520 RepID=UPI001A9A2D04|nr:ABC transporter ATP-binding protein [Clostridium beijerinckii]
MNIQCVYKTIKLILEISKGLLIVSILLSVFLGFSPIISMILSQELLNALQLKKEIYGLMLLFVSYITFSIFSSIITNISNYVDEKLQIKLGYRLNYIIMEKCGKLSLEHFEESEIYNQITRLENDVTYKPYQSLQAVMTLISSIISFGSSIVILFTWKPLIIIVIMLLSCAGLFYYLKIGKEEFNIHYELSGKEREAWYLSYLLTHDLAFKEINLLNIKEYFLNKYWDIKENIFQKQNGINKKKTTFSCIFEILQELLISIVVLMALISAYYGSILIGNVATYIKTISLIQSNTNTIISSLYSIYNNNLYMKLFDDFMNIEVVNENVGKEIDTVESIELKNISFDYSNDKKALDNVNLKINKGETVAVIGKNGSGKSTLLKLICGLYTINQGEILINGINLKEINKTTYKNRLSVLFQDYVKYEMTLKENIILGDISKDEKNGDILNALKLAGGDFFDTSSNNDILNIQLGNWFDEGVQLSGGQWQKIALSRTYYRDRDVYLLDEPSAALDPDAEINVFSTFYKLSRNSIGLFITHKVAAARKASKIIVLDNGKVVGCGTDEYLSKNCPAYIELKEKGEYEY